MRSHESSPSTDEMLLESLRRGETGAFERLAERYSDRIFGFGLKMCGEREDALDVLQDTLLQAFRSIDKIEHAAALRSWLFRVASNACLMKRRKGKYEPARELSLEELAPRNAEEARIEIPDPSTLPDAGVERAEIRRRLREAIQQLPQHYRVVLVLRDLEQMSSKQVGDVLDLPESTVKMRLHRARLMLRKQLAQYYSRESDAV
ncbi:MAG: sigma-70 family RNA polymerase sigma factor [Acidobacteriota bacterium]|nr:MAG: sigma-70 family RNA polymerase sigma factor [Acidobacteriota bacterium]